MSLSVVKLQAQVADVTLIFGEEGEEAPDTLTLWYRPNAITPALDADLQQLVSDPDRARTYTEAFSSLIAKDGDGAPRWDLLDADGRPYPTDPAALAALGYPFLNAVMGGIMEDFQPAKSRIAHPGAMAENGRTRRKLS
jgi:hypothetical protein